MDNVIEHMKELYKLLASEDLADAIAAMYWNLY